MDYSSWKESKSFHYFLYPFMFQEKNDVRTLAKILEQQNDWTYVEENNSQELSEFSKEARRQYYAVRKYFNEQARMIVFGNKTWEETPLTSLYLPNAKNGILSCEIQGQTYELSVMRIRLNLYQFGVGILIFELAAPLEKNYSFNDILKINQAIRRVYPPFVVDQKQHELMPHSMQLVFSDGVPLQIHTKQICDDWKDGEVNPFDYESGLPELLQEVICYHTNEELKDQIQSLLVKA